MTAAVLDYGQRAAARPKPAGWVQPLEALQHNPDQALELALSGYVYYADHSQYQPPLNRNYPYAIDAFRVDNGWAPDPLAAENWSVAESWDQLRLVFGYFVFIPGQTFRLKQRLVDVFGRQPHPKLKPYTDMESGNGFAGPGNHSTEANDLQAWLADWTGSQLDEVGYANGYDWSSCWPGHPSWMKRILAMYSSAPTPPGFYGRQYYGALPYPVPPGYPTHCEPFGSYVDMNVIPHSLDEVLAHFQGDWLSMATEDDVRRIVRQEIVDANRALMHGSDHPPFSHHQHPRWVGRPGHGVDSRLDALEHGQHVPGQKLDGGAQPPAADGT